MSGQLARSLEVTKASTLSLSCVFWNLTLGVPAQAQRDRVVWNSYRLETTMTSSTGHGYGGSGTLSDKDAHGFTTRRGSDPRDPSLRGEREGQDCV